MVALRNPDQTRQRILDAALEEIHLRGFQGMRIEHILTRTGLTKGALYHHFSNKMAIGYAIVEEILEVQIRENWVKPLCECRNPIEAIVHICREERGNNCPEDIEKGCPLNNLTQEMSPIDDGFRERLNKVYQLWIEAITNALLKGQQQGLVRADIVPAKIAQFLLAALQGIVGVAKCQRCDSVLDDMAECMFDYLASLLVDPKSIQHLQHV